MYGPYPQWPGFMQPQQQGFGGTPYPVFIPTPTLDGKPPSTKPMTPKRMFKAMLEAQKSWEDFQKSGGKKEEKKDDKPKVPMYTLQQVILVLWALSIPVGFLSLYLYIKIAQSMLGPIATTIGIK